ncbi:MAG TPA: TonB-dependent receptor [Bacteroidetes bacterium]|nr:TonB-dependent receptor [Bacteroidota bacterium]
MLTTRPAPSQRIWLPLPVRLALTIALTSYVLLANTDSTQIDSVRTFSSSAIVVSASRWAERASTVSRQITVIRSDDVRDRNPGTAADMLEGTGEVFVQRSQAGGGSPRLRGFAANSVLLVIDGVRMNNAIYRSGNLQNLIQVDANSLASTEVLFGPGSVQYGSDALGGVIAMQTKDPVFFDSGVKYFGGGFIRSASASQERSGSIEFDVSLPSFGSYTALTYSSFGDLRSGRMMPSELPEFGLRPWTVQRINGRDTVVANPDPHRQISSGYDQVNALQKFRWKLDDAMELRYIGLFTTSSDVPRYDRLVETRAVGSSTRPRSAEWYYGPQTWLINSLALDIRRPVFIADELKVTIAHQWFEESRHSRNFGNPVRRDQLERLSIVSANIDAKIELDDSGNDRDLYYGVEATFQDVESRASNVNIDTDLTTPGVTRYPDGGSVVSQIAAYTQLRWEFHPRLSIAAGLRATAIQLRSQITPESVFKTPFTSIQTDPSAVTGSIGSSWTATDILTFHGNVASGFRAPNVDDIAKVFESEPGRVVVPNPGLRPVTVLTAEGGLHITPLEGVTFQATAYSSWLSDALEKRPFSVDGRDSIDFNGQSSQVIAVQNVGTARIWGISMALDAEFRSVRLHAAVTGVWGRDETNNVPLEHVTPAFGLVRLHWSPARRLDLSADVRWSAAWLVSEISPADQPLIGVTIPQGGLPAWTVAGVRASYDLNTTFTLQAAVENIFDLQYRPAGSGISAPGRNIVTTLRVRL